MSVIINQPQGLGDIIFCMAIAQHLKGLGHDIVAWPVNTAYAECAKHFPQVEMCDLKRIDIDYNKKDFAVTPENMLVIPLRFSEFLMQAKPNDCMRSKYLMAGLDMELWRTCKFVRDIPNEEKLMKLLGIKEGQPFALVNKFFKTSSKGIAKIPNPKLKVIEMKTIAGFTMIDWSGVIMAASEIHTVGTSVNYLIELLMPKCPVHLYVRRPEETDFKNYDYIFSDNISYVLHP